jgi:hypothetical protein
MQDLVNVSPIWLGCRIADGGLSIECQNSALGDGLAVWLDKNTTTTLALTDFEHAGERCRVSAFTIRDDGTLEPWARMAEGVSLLIAAESTERWLHVVVVAVAYEPAGSVSGRLMEVHQPDSWQVLVRVRVPAEDTRPGG